MALISTEERTPPVIIAKSDGSFLYMTTDLGTVVFRENKKFMTNIFISLTLDKKNIFHNYLAQSDILNFQIRSLFMLGMEL